MTKQLRVGIIGFAHMHIIANAKVFARHPQVKMIACADTIPDQPDVCEEVYSRKWNQEYLVEKLRIPNVYSNYSEMLEKEKLDIVLVTSENDQHADVVEACARHKVHVCVEKPMSVSLVDGQRMSDACQKNKVLLVTNWPVAWSPVAHHIKTLIEQNKIGRLLEIKWRGGHTGPLGNAAVHPGLQEKLGQVSEAKLASTWWHQKKAGGGALLDYCCYGAMLSRWYYGCQADSVSAVATNLASSWGDADDNAIVIIHFPESIALVEGSWTTLSHGTATGPIIYGTSGTLVADFKANSITLDRGDKNQEAIQPEKLAEKNQDLATHMIEHLESGHPLLPILSHDFNLEVMAILDAATQSASRRKTTTLK